jgi:serine/threonine protein kinase/Flp pilus assembly protein TadD
MSPEHNDVQGPDGGLSAALVACLEALDAGRPPDRQELLARYPQHAAELARFLDDQEQVDRCAAPLRALGLGAPAPGGEPAGGAPERLGDFRIVREVGRGGMGVVYEAEQISLGRRVALKVLPFAAAMDPRQLQRFKNEARAAASLRHEHIVQVHAVGCERGLHFIAMDFIEGATLARLIREAHHPEPAPAEAADPGAPAAGEAAPTLRAAGLTTEGGKRGPGFYRSAARLIAQAAEALEYAHSLGVVHRDVKPGNLLVDQSGKLWVADFGLARFGTDAGLTVSGDLIGTLRYMSPEQALAKHGLVDHRADVYALGATLYELLTLRPAFGGDDRQELLRQIAFEEPTPLRRLERAVPAELETVVLKALEKNPADRYATAKELADDLRRWLEDKPIRARRPSLRQVALRWARRHRAVVWAAAAVLLVAAGLGGGTWVSWAHRRAVAEAKAQEAVQEANRFLQQERWPEALSAARRAAEVLAGVGADPGLRRQVEELSKDLEMAQRLQEARLREAAVKDGHFDAEMAMAGYAQAFRWYGLDQDSLNPHEAGERIRARPVRRQLVAALDHWAWAGSGMGSEGWAWAAAAARVADPGEWRGRLRDALGRKDSKALDELLASAPAEQWSSKIGLISKHKGFSASERALSLLRHAQEQHPDDFWTNHDLAFHLHQSRPPRLEEAVRYYTAAVALRPQSPGARVNLGSALRERGDPDGAIAQHRAAIHLKPDYAEAHNRLGNALTDKGLLDEAVAEFREALRLKPDFADAHSNLGDALREKGQLDEAIAESREATRLKPDYFAGHATLGAALAVKGQLDEAIAEFREATRLKPDDPAVHNNLGKALAAKGQLDEAIAECRKATQLKPDCDLAYNTLGAALQRKGLLDEAAAAYREAIRINKDYPEAHCNLGDLLRQMGRFREAVTALRRGHELGSRQPGWRHPSAQLLRQAELMAELDVRLTAALQGKGQPKDAAERVDFAQLCQEFRKLYAAAARFYGEGFAAQPALADDLSSGRRYNAACAAALAGCGQGLDAAGLDEKERARLRQQALDWLRADLGAWRRLLEKDPDKARPAVIQQMQHWLGDTDFAGVRGEAALGKLPEAERSRWQQLWGEVEALRRGAAGPVGSPADSRPQDKEGSPKNP